MDRIDIHSDDFVEAVVQAGQLACRSALEAGQSVVYMEASGRYVEERPDGRRFEVRFDSSKPRESHRIIVQDIISHAA